MERYGECVAQRIWIILLIEPKPVLDSERYVFVCQPASNISANVFAAFSHDHIFVPLTDSEKAMSAPAALAAD